MKFHLTALQSVAANDICTLRIICLHSRNGQYSLEEVDRYGNTALLRACYLGRLECVTVLIDFAANIQAINYFGQNALTLATHSGNYAIIRELLRYRSYEDFNKSSIVPAICVAALRQNQRLIDFYKTLERTHGEDIFTVHGLNCEDIQDMLKIRSRPPKNIVI